MPWEVKEENGRHCVFNKITGRKVACHDTREEALAQQRALYANVPDSKAVGFSYLELDGNGEGQDRFDALSDSAKLDLYYRFIDLGEMEL